MVRDMPHFSHRLTSPLVQNQMQGKRWESSSILLKSFLMVAVPRFAIGFDRELFAIVLIVPPRSGNHPP